MIILSSTYFSVSRGFALRATPDWWLRIYGDVTGTKLEYKEGQIIQHDIEKVKPLVEGNILEFGEDIACKDDTAAVRR